MLPSNLANTTFPQTLVTGPSQTSRPKDTPGSCFCFHPQALFPRCNLLPVYNKNKKPSRNGAGSQDSPERSTNEELLAIDGELTTRSERLWCVRRAGTSGGAAATLSLPAPPVIFRQDAPHHTAPASFSTLFITQMPSFAEQARPCPSLSYLLSNICRLVFLLPPEHTGFPSRKSLVSLHRDT